MLVVTIFDFAAHKDCKDREKRRKIEAFAHNAWHADVILNNPPDKPESQAGVNSSASGNASNV